MRTAELTDGTRTVAVRASNLLPPDADPGSVLELHWGCVTEGAVEGGWSAPPPGSVLPSGTRDPDDTAYEVAFGEYGDGLGGAG